MSGHQTIKQYQDARLRERAAPKSINEEIGFLLRVMDSAGDILRARLRKKGLLSLRIRRQIGKASDPEEKARMSECAKLSRSPHIYPALRLALNAGMRDGEMKNLTWARLDFDKRYFSVDRSKTKAGEGRTIPLNSVLEGALAACAEWYQRRFAEFRPKWYVFPDGKPRPNHPTRPVTTLTTAWRNLRDKAAVQGRWHDNRHTWVSWLRQNGVSLDDLQELGSWQTPSMVLRYAHIGPSHLQDRAEVIDSVLKSQNLPTREASVTEFGHKLATLAS